LGLLLLRFGIQTLTRAICVALDARYRYIVDDTVGCDGEGIKLRGGYGFEVSTTETDKTGTNGTWTRVNATAATKDTVTLSGIPGQVKALRYAWEDSPSIFTGTGPAVYNAEGLPATPSLLDLTAQ
jgi:hypothetical protein